MIHTLKENIKKILGIGTYKVDRDHHQRILKLYKQFVKPGDLVFDIGANTGNRVMPLLELGAKVVAVEPQEKCIATLKIRFGDKIRIEPVGLDAKPGEKSMHISDNTVLSTFSDEWIEQTKAERFKGNDWQHKQTVAMTTFDELIRKHGKPRFAKIDVEGYEKNVFSGLSQRIDHLSFEYAVPEQTANLKECLDMLKAINPAATCNYCTGEEMELKLSQWISVDEMKRVMDSESFTATRFGDIYVKNIA